MNGECEALFRSALGGQWLEKRYINAVHLHLFTADKNNRYSWLMCHVPNDFWYMSPPIVHDMNSRLFCGHK